MLIQFELQKNNEWIFYKYNFNYHFLNRVTEKNGVALNAVSNGEKGMLHLGRLLRKILINDKRHEHNLKR